MPVPHPNVTDYQFVSAGTTPPTVAQCAAAGLSCFSPQAIQSAYNVGRAGKNGRASRALSSTRTGSDTIAHDLRVDHAFELAPMCGEEGVTCAAGMPTFWVLSLKGSPATKAQPGRGTHQEDKSACPGGRPRCRDLACDRTEGEHPARAHDHGRDPGVQGLPKMMKAEQYVVSTISPMSSRRASRRPRKRSAALRLSSTCVTPS